MLLLSSIVAACDGGGAPPDGSVPDGGGLDASLSEAGAVDAAAPVDAGPSDTGLADASTAESFRAVCRGESALFCTSVYACGTPSQRALYQALYGFTDEASCATALAATAGAYCLQLADGVEAGRSTVDLDRLRACADHLASVSCETYLSESASPAPVCVGTPFVTGRVASGGACAVDTECATAGDVCSASAATLGTCGPLPSAGEPCLGDRCAVGLTCASGVCASSVGLDCLVDTDCLDGWCDQPGNDFHYVDGLHGTCAAHRALGEECDDFLACATGLYCDNTHGFGSDGFRAPGNCAAPRPAGAPCNEPVDCVSGVCSSAGLCS